MATQIKNRPKLEERREGHEYFTETGPGPHLNGHPVVSWSYGVPYAAAHHPPRQKGDGRTRRDPAMFDRKFQRVPFGGDKHLVGRAPADPYPYLKAGLGTHRYLRGDECQSPCLSMPLSLPKALSGHPGLHRLHPLSPPSPPRSEWPPVLVRAQTWRLPSRVTGWLEGSIAARKAAGSRG